MRKRLATVLLVLVSCLDITSPSGPASLELRGPNPTARNFTVEVGKGITVTAVVKDANGTVMQTHDQELFASRNPDRAEIDVSGRVTVKSAGTTYLVASLAIGNRVLTDSVRVIGTDRA